MNNAKETAIIEAASVSMSAKVTAIKALRDANVFPNLRECIDAVNKMRTYPPSMRVDVLRNLAKLSDNMPELSGTLAILCGIRHDVDRAIREISTELGNLNSALSEIDYLISIEEEK